MENPAAAPDSILDFHESTANANQFPYLPLEQVELAHANQQVLAQSQYPKLQVFVQNTQVPATATQTLFSPNTPSTSGPFYAQPAHLTQTACNQLCQTQLPLEEKSIKQHKQFISKPEQNPRNHTMPSHKELITSHTGHSISTDTRNQPLSRIPITLRMGEGSLQPENVEAPPDYDSRLTYSRYTDGKRTPRLLHSIKSGQAENRLQKIGSDHDSGEDTCTPLKEYRFHRAQTVALGSFDHHIKRKRTEAHPKPDSLKRNKLARLDSPSRPNALPSSNSNPTNSLGCYHDSIYAESVVQDSAFHRARRNSRAFVTHQPNSLDHGFYANVINDGHEFDTSHLRQRHSKEALVLSSPVSSVSSGMLKADVKGRLREERQQTAQSAYNDNDHLFSKKPVPNPNGVAFLQKTSAHRRVALDKSLNINHPIKMSSKGRAQYHDKHDPIYISSSSEDTEPLRAEKNSVSMRKRALPLDITQTKRAASRARTPGSSKRAATPRLPASPKQTMKTFRRADTKALKMNEEEMRQKRAAELIIEKEVEAVRHAKDLQIFGEIVPDDEEKKRLKIECERAAVKAVKEARQWQEAIRHEKQHTMEMEKQRQAAEAAEVRRLQKEREEIRKKAIREAERERNEAAEEMMREEKRQAAIDKIEAGRLKAIAEAEERARAKREAEEKARCVQADRDDMDALRAKQEIARKQATSLNSAKIQCVQNQQSEDIDSLFIPDSTGKPHETDFSVRRSRATSVGPSSAAHLFAPSRPEDPEGTYRAERDAIENRNANLIRQNQEERRKQQEKYGVAATQATKPKSTVENAPRNSSARTGIPMKQRIDARESYVSKTAATDNTKALQAKSAPQKSSVMAVNPFVEDDSEDEIMTTTFETVTGVALQPQSKIASQREAISNPDSSFDSFNASFQSINSTPGTTVRANETRLKVTPQCASSLNIGSNAERQFMESRLAANTKAKNSKRTDAQKLARKQQHDKKARERKTQQLLDEAKASGIELSEDMLDVQLDAYMTKREKDNQRRTETRLRNGSVAASKANALTLGSIRAQAPLHSSITIRTNGEVEIYDTTKHRARKATGTAAHDIGTAPSGGRGSRFAQAAQQKTVAHLQESESEESVEDPDDETPLMIDDQACEGPGAESVEDEDEHELRQVVKNAIRPREHDVHSSDPLSENFSLCNDSSRGDPPTAHDETEKPHKPTIPGQIYVYTIFEQSDREEDPVDNEPQHVETFTDRDDANRCARERLLKWRDKHDSQCPGFTDSYDDNKLYSGRVWCNRSRTESIYMKVRRFVQASTELPNSDTLIIRPRLPEKSWIMKRITRTVIESPVDGESQTIGPIKILEQEMIEEGFLYSNLPDANRAARQRAFAFLKPAKATYENVEQHENKWGKELRNAEIECTEAGDPFNVYMDVTDDELRWMKPITYISFVVELYLMKGPLN